MRGPEINSIIVGGNLTRDAEYVTFQNKDGDGGLTKFSIAVNRSRLKNNEWEKETFFIDCVVFNKGAKRFAEMKKGEAVVVEGRLQCREYVNKETITVKVFEIVAESTHWIKGADKGSSSLVNDTKNTPSNDDDDDDVPF